MLNIVKARTTINNMKLRSAWLNGVRKYALELLDKLEDQLQYNPELAETISSSQELNKLLLNGADNWRQYSYGGNALIYDSDIASRLCTASELVRCKYGDRQINAKESWLDVQARALDQASNIVTVMCWTN